MIHKRISSRFKEINKTNIIFLEGNIKKITTFNPQIITKDAAPIVQLFEELALKNATIRKASAN